MPEKKFMYNCCGGTPDLISATKLCHGSGKPFQTVFYTCDCCKKIYSENWPDATKLELYTGRLTKQQLVDYAHTVEGRMTRKDEDGILQQIADSLPPKEEYGGRIQYFGGRRFLVVAFKEPVPTSLKDREVIITILPENE